MSNISEASDGAPAYPQIHHTISIHIGTAAEVIDCTAVVAQCFQKMPLHRHERLVFGFSFPFIGNVNCEDHKSFGDGLLIDGDDVVSLLAATAPVLRENGRVFWFSVVGNIKKRRHPAVRTDAVEFDPQL